MKIREDRMNRDKDRFNKILFVVFMFALAFGAYLILGPKVTALINTHGQINEINLTYPILSTTTDELLKISPCRFARSYA